MPTAVINVAAGHTSEPCQRLARDLATQLGAPFNQAMHDTDPARALYTLVVAFHPEYDYQLELHTPGNRTSPLIVDFLKGTLAHREKFGGGRGQPLARALGLKHGKSPHIVDLTAGLGRDAFIIASLGCHVNMIERNAVLHKLLEDGARRAALAKHALFADNPLGSPQLSLHFGDSLSLLEDIAPHKRTVIYLDPMYPGRTKSALVKKEMRILRDLVGNDTDTEHLLISAMRYAQQRVVVKRPKKAPTLTGPAPSYNIVSKNTRYDIYNVL